MFVRTKELLNRILDVMERLVAIHGNYDDRLAALEQRCDANDVDDDATITLLNIAIARITALENGTAPGTQSLIANLRADLNAIKKRLKK